MSHIAQTAQRIRVARCPEDLFGADSKAVNDAFRALAKIVHPDHCVAMPAAVQKEATAVFALLNELKRQADHKVADGSYGDRKPVVPPKKTVIRVAGDQIELGPLLRAGDIADVYAGQLLKKGQQVVVKIARAPKDNDLIRNERDTLAKLAPLGEKALRYIVEPTRAALDVGGRAGNVLVRYPEHVPLDVIVARARPFDFRDMAWILRRTLEGLGHVHKLGIVHGGIIPPNLLFHPNEHGLRMIDWCYAVPAGKPAKAMSSAWSAYPPEVAAKKPLTPATDIYMAVWCAQWALGPDGWKTTPRPIWRFLQGCLLDSAAKRPSDAWALYDEFGELLRRLVGPPKYHQLNLLPAGSFT